MVERRLDKIIRVLKELLKPSSNKRMDGEGIPHKCVYLDTYGIQLPQELLFNILSTDLKLTISSDYEIPTYEGGEPTNSGSGEYLVEVIIENEENRLVSLLKEYEKQLPKRKKSIVREKTLELIAKKIGDLDSGSNLVRFLDNCGVDKELIIYPNTKWRMVYDALVYLSSSNKEEDKEAFSKVIGEATHPLMHKGDEDAASLLRKQFDEYLKYDNRGVAYDKDTGTYLALLKMDDDEARMYEQAATDEWVEVMEEKMKKQLEFMCQPENKEKISLLRKAYQALMNVVFLFCEKPSNPTVELNEGFKFLYKLVNSIRNELKLTNVEAAPFSRNEHFFYLPFNNLFEAEKVYKEKGSELSWQKIRPEMNAMYGDIEELYQEVNGSDVIAEPDKQRKLNDIQLYLSELKEKSNEIKKTKEAEVSTISKIEITKLPELQIKGFEEKVVFQKLKNKRIQLRKFPVDLRWEEISIRFLNEQEIIVKAKNDTHQTTYEAMGFQDEKKKLPNKQWQFLRLLSLKKGEVTWENNSDLPLKQINSIKKQKQLLSETLKSYFQIYDSEPFSDYKKEKAYRIKITLTPEPELKDIDEQEIYDK